MHCIQNSRGAQFHPNISRYAWDDTIDGPGLVQRVDNYLEGFENWPEYHVYDEGACACCQGLTAFTLEKLKSANEYEKNKGMSVIIGPYKKLPKGVKPGKDTILIGTCTKQLGDEIRDQCLYINGCPPNEGTAIPAIAQRKNPPDTSTHLSDCEKRRIGELPYLRDEKAMVDNVKPFLDYLKKTRKK